MASSAYNKAVNLLSNQLQQGVLTPEAYNKAIDNLLANPALASSYVSSMSNGGSASMGNYGNGSQHHVQDDARRRLHPQLLCRPRKRQHLHHGVVHMPMQITANFTCDVCGRQASMAIGSGKNERAPDGWMVTFGTNPKKPSETKYLCEVHNLEVKKTEADQSAVTVLRDSKDALGVDNGLQEAARADA